METANRVKNKISGFLQETVFPKLKLILDEYNPSGKILQIDALKLNIVTTTNFNLNDIAVDLTHQFSQVISESIENSEITYMKENDATSGFKRNGIKLISSEEKQKELLLFFLEKGYLPWNAQEGDIRTFIQTESWYEVLKDKRFVSNIVGLLKQNEIHIDRFLLQFPPEIIISFLFSIHTEKKDLPEAPNLFIRAIKRLVSKRNKGWAAEFFEKFIDSTQKNDFLSLAANKEFIKKVAAAFEKESYLQTEHKDFIPSDLEASGIKDNSKDSKIITEEVFNEIEEKPFFEADEKGIAIQNAGLILLHLFLKPFFQKLGLLDEKGGIKKPEMQVAIQTLHYLATGKEEFFEGNLVFEKFLCGLPLKMPMQRDSLLTDEIKDESQLLLTEVIRHWAALKSTSPDGLRQLFILRNGKLIKVSTNYRVIVERKAQDVLLDGLTWNLSMIKLPWKKELILIEW